MSLRLPKAFGSYVVWRQIAESEGLRRFLLILPFTQGPQNNLQRITWPWEYSGNVDGDEFRAAIAREIELFRQHVDYELNRNGLRLYPARGRLICVRTRPSIHLEALSSVTTQAT
jgi:hypothetical protein